MATKIRVLTDDTINKIAAGEVIENPASVVKELVENSIDAGATEITIEINSGGRQLIRITDNGCGMVRDDALLSLERHATSKIRSVDDIEGVLTMGFRGEAIPSIASISKFTLLTCPEEGTGTLIIVDGGKIFSVSDAARARGTTIEVKNLFFNVPVRRKFMKSPAVDANEVLKVATMIAVGNPLLKFHLISDGKTELNTSRPPSEDFQTALKRRIYDLLGQEFSDNCCFFERSSEEFTLKGFIGTPSYNRHNRTGQWLFVNGRGVVAPLIATAVKEGYGPCLSTGRYPVFVLHLHVDGELVDVNVHPQKREVRLRQEQFFREQIAKGVQDGIQQVPEKEELQPLVSPVFAEAIRAPISFEPAPRWTFTPPPRVELPKAPPITYRPAVEPQREQQMRFEAPLQEPKVLPRVIATLPGYVIVEGEGSALAVIDQKAAHCRILFEEFSQAIQGAPVSHQPLLVPHSLELMPNEAAELRKILPQLNAMGVHVREFGPRSFIVESVPDILAQESIETLLLDLLENENISGASLDQARKVSIAMNKKAVSAKKRLTMVEAQSLVEQLYTCENRKVCPQGRTICTSLSSEDMNRVFQQAMAGAL